jgi:sulfite reductase (ferredoxin)
LVKAKEKNIDLSQIKNALVYSSRALLIVKGVDPKDEEEAISSFLDKFVKSGICSPEFENLNKVYLDTISGKVSKEQAYEYTQRFYQEVKEIYSSMDSNFNFPLRFKKRVEEQPLLSSQDRPLAYDLRGTPCPINYVKVKLKLEELKVGEILEVYLDDGEPIQNVPRSLQNDGQEILKIEQIENFFKVVVKSKV